MYDGAGDDGDETLEAGHPFHRGQVGREGRSIQHNIAQTLQWFIFLKKSIEGARLHSYYPMMGRQCCRKVLGRSGFVLNPGAEYPGLGLRLEKQQLSLMTGCKKSKLEM